MKRDQSSVERRRSQILKQIREQEEVRVEDLAKQFGMSAMSVRRDLQYLEDRKLITRFYGGATVNPDYRSVSPEEELALYRRLLGRYAASKICNGETIFINGSMAALGTLDFITAHNVHIITNNGMAVTKKRPKGVSVTLTGGELREHVMVGDNVLRVLLDSTADKTILGCAGVTPNGEFCYNIPMEIGINETMIARTAKELYILADHTKMENVAENTARYGSCTYDRQVTLITDEKADPATVESLRKLGIEVYQVGLNDVNF
ncbi:MAG: DeoR/GlpR transcriptional regulator [Oscillospiraceae bacterium]|nr:DeoR/GlpR transcriptional regulator [Oscillospiraceae bacterium]